MNEDIGKILGIFEEISAVPRCSKHEEKISRWLSDWAVENKFEHKTDEVGNVVIKVPATSGYENAPVVALQGHMDMVCVKDSDCKHNFDTDPIVPIIEEDWLTAQGTTLGADNGIAIAMALYLAKLDLPHPPLELLFTVDEETGLTGVNSIKEDFLESSLFINIDSEDEGTFTIGCAGGRDVDVKLPLQYEESADNSSFLEIIINGLQGGHSGVDINKNKACSNKLMARLLFLLKEKFSFNLAEICGGTAHNAISRQTKAVICCFTDDISAIIEELDKFQTIIAHEYYDLEPDFHIEHNAAKSFEQVFTEETTEETINLLMALPHGVAAVTPHDVNLVETSDNLAIIKTEKDDLKILISIRSAIGSRLDALTHRISAIADLAGATAYYDAGYPAWEPNPDSELLKKSMEVYKETFQKEAKILIIHAGLECAVIAQKFPEMDMISIGPTIKNPHCPQERLNLPSLEKTWEFLVKLLSAIK